MKLNLLVHPTVLIIAPFLISCAAWLLPGESYALRGFAQRSEPSFGAFLVLGVWYASVVLIVILGSSIGRALPRSRVLEDHAERPKAELRTLRILTLVAVLGVGYATFLAARAGSPLDALTAGQGNELNQAVGGEAGLATLRYAAAASAPIAVYLWRKKIAGAQWVFVNGALLLISALFSSRLSLILAGVIGVMLFSRDNPTYRLRLGKSVSLLSIAFLLLAVYNWFRNFRFYETWGVSNPLMMNFYQIVSYLGTPFQVSAGVADAMIDGYTPNSDFVHSANVAIPTFLQSEGTSQELRGPARYDFHADVLGSLTTNSAFADLYSSFGWWGYFWLGVCLFLAAILYGYTLSYSSSVAAVSGVMAYCFAELWRIPLFNQGMIVFLVLLIFSSVLLTATRSSELVRGSPNMGSATVPTSKARRYQYRMKKGEK